MSIEDHKNDNHIACERYSNQNAVGFAAKYRATSWISTASAVLLLSLCGVVCADESTRFPLPGDWPAYRRNASLDGHAEGVGRIDERPSILWRHRIGSILTKLSVKRDAKSNRVQLPYKYEMKRTVRDLELARWHVPRIKGDIGGNDRRGIPTGTTTYAEILTDSPGLEKIEFPSSFDQPTLDGHWQYAPGTMSAWRDGKWEVIWQTEPIELCFRARPLVADFDDDGQLEVAILPWREVRIYDARTGQLEYHCEFTKGRSYGLFGHYDFDGDGKSEFLVMSDFAKHIDVLGFRDRNLALLWQENIELDITNPRINMRVLPEPVVDLDGDGRLELIVNLFNKNEDQKWHLVVYDAMTGEVTSELVDEIAQGVADVDGDASTEVFTTATRQGHIPSYGKIRVRRLDERRFSTVWEEDEAAWQCHRTPTVPHLQNEAAYGREGVLMRSVDGHLTVVTCRPVADDSDEIAFTVRSWEEKFAAGLTLVASRAHVEALDDQGALLVEVLSSPGKKQEVYANSGSIHILSTSSSNQSILIPPAVVRIPGSELPLAVVQDTSLASCPSWVVFKPPNGDSASQDLWRLSGAGIVKKTTKSYGGDIRAQLKLMSMARNSAVVADLTGDGRRYLIVAGASRLGNARLAAIDLQTGKPLWKKDFDRFSAGRVQWNIGEPYLWQAGRFTDESHQDVLITLRRSRMHSEETFLLSGEDGSIVWHRDRQIADRGFGGQLFAIADYDGNGLEDLASFYTHIHYIVDGATGTDLVAGENYWVGVPTQPVYWGQPVAGRFDQGMQTPSLLFTTTRHQMVGLVRVDGSLVWSDAYDVAANGFPAVGDFDGDTTQEALFVGFEDGARCYDITSGKLEWKLDLGGKVYTDSVVSGDIDGDGRDEALYVLGRTLYCIGFDTLIHAGHVEWQLELPTTVSSPILADIHATDGKPGSHLSILVTGLDGYVYCIGK